MIRNFFLTATIFSNALALTTPSPNNNNCAVVGVGVLGTSLCRQILDAPEFRESAVVGITKTKNNHPSILETAAGDDDSKKDRFQLSTVDECNQKFANVVFCAPPSGSEDYAADVKKAAEKFWLGPDGGGVFVFTSSGSVYDSSLTEVNEKSKLVDPETNPRAARLFHAEHACLDAGGCVLRLAGLYTLTRGAHNFWLTSGKPVSGHPDGLINLLHYDDAAGACLAALRAGPSVCAKRAFLISDGNPMTRKGICESALQAKTYEGYKLPEFSGDGSPGGKTYDGSVTNAALSWTPQYESFDKFMRAN